MVREKADSHRAPDLPSGAEHQLLDLVASRLSIALYRGRLVERQLHVDYLSPQIESLTGRDAAALGGKADPFIDLIHPDDRRAYAQALAEAAAVGSASVDYRVALGPETYGWRRDEMVLAPNESTGSPPDAVINGCIVDITEERKSAAGRESLLRERQAIINQASHPILLCDAESRVFEINAAAASLFCAERQKPEEMPDLDALFAPDSRDSLSQTIEALSKGKGEKAAATPLTLTARRRSGDTLPVEAMVSVVELEAERATVIEMRDISEQLSAEAEVSRLWRLLQDAMENIPNGFAVYDAEEKLVLCNTAYAALYDETPDSMVGSSTVENYQRSLPLMQSLGGVPSEELSKNPEHWLKHVRASETEPVEFQLKSGAWNQTTAHPIHGGGRVYVRTDITKLKKAEMSLRKSEQQFRNLVENNPFPLWLTDTDTGIVLYHSPAAAALLGYDAWPISEDYKSERSYADPEERRRCTDELLEKGRLDGRETLLQRADGSTFWGAVFSRLCEHDGKTIAIGGVIDLTDQREKEDQLRQAQDTLHDAVESLSEGFALYDAEDRLVTCNQRYRDFNRMSADVLKPGVAWADFIRAGAERGQYVGAEGRVEEWLAERKRLRMEFGSEMEFQQADGRWFQFANQPTRQGGIVVTRSDVTNRKEMERALRESENLVRSILEASPVPVAMTRASDGLIVYESPASRALFGQMQQPGEPSYVRDLYVDARDRQRYLTMLRERGTMEGFEVEFRKADGQHIWVSLTSSLIEYQGEEMIVASAYDLTERRAVEAEMARHREALYQSEKLSALGSLLAGVAHELNNPLSVVVGHAQLLKETASEPRTVERATKIGNAADRCSRIVKSFLAMARQRPPERRAVDLSDIIQATLDVTGYSLRTANIDVSVEVDPEVPAIWADPDQLNQVVTNLIVNAQQAMMEVEGPRKLTVKACYDEHREQVVLTLTDTGPGVPAELRSRIFEPFFTTKEIGEGTGIGLSVSHRIIESHDGHIQLDGNQDQGATFTVSLPATRSEDTPKPRRQEPARDQSGRSAKILIIDDEPDVAQMLGDILAAEGYQVETADSGEKALTLIARDSFDVILSDVRMPRLDGPSLYATLERQDPSLLKRTAFVSGDTLSPSAPRLPRKGPSALHRKAFHLGRGAQPGRPDSGASGKAPCD